MSHPITVLVVDDDFLARLHLVDALQSASFDVVEVASADEAIKVLEERETTFALCSRTSKCQDRWMESRLLTMSANDGHPPF